MENFTDLGRLNRAFQDIEVETGIDARVDYYCCENHAREAMKRRGKGSYLLVTGPGLDVGFKTRVTLTLMSGTEITLARAPDMEGPIDVCYQFESGTDAVQKKAIEVLLHFGFMADLKDGQGTTKLMDATDNSSVSAH